MRARIAWAAGTPPSQLQDTIARAVAGDAVYRFEQRGRSSQ